MEQKEFNVVKRQKGRGFQLMTPERLREVARKGGAAVPDSKRSFAKDHALAAAAGKKGGSTPRVKNV